MSKNCDDKECQHWTSDGCFYSGAMIRGLCRRKYMQQQYKDKKRSAVSGQQSAKEEEIQELEIDAKEVRTVQVELEKPEEDAVIGPTVSLDFDGDDQLYEELKKAAEDELRTVRNQALWYIKQGVKHDSAG